MYNKPNLKKQMMKRGEIKMKILFCNISWMKYYKGVIPNVDEPMNGGKYCYFADRMS